MENIVDIARDADGLWLRLKYDGLPEERNFTWDPLNTTHEDILEMVENYLKSCRKKKLAFAAAYNFRFSL